MGTKVSDAALFGVARNGKWNQLKWSCNELYAPAIKQFECAVVGRSDALDWQGDLFGAVVVFDSQGASCSG